MLVDKFDASVSAGGISCIALAKIIRGKGNNSAAIMVIIMPALLCSWKMKEMSHDASIMVNIMKEKTTTSINAGSLSVGTNDNIILCYFPPIERN